ncbi:secretogranin-2 [Salmo trutta]|uniref:Secretogranin II n=1 Tax=Salmo trutta TaxID=8032 RepID=A0A673YXN2_SALTR|nr:secretogranin-2-like [Salmo trutta]
MPSLPKLSSAGMAFLLSLLPLLLLGSGSAQGASLREHRLRGSELDPQRGDTPYLPPNADMLKALEYIESLRQRTGASAPQEQASLTPDYDTTNMDTDSEKLLSMLRLASPAQTSQSNIGQGQDQDEDDEEGEGNKENKTHEWLQAVLNTLQQTKKGPKPAPVRPSAAHHALGKGRRPTKEEDSQVGEGMAYPWSQRASLPHRKYPLMFEDEEDGEEEGKVQGRESPFKRTNENMEGKYTPQNLANLQSVFEELGRIANAKAGHKRQTEDDEDDEDDDDMFKVRNLAYEDVTGGEDWTPLEEQVDTEDEERDNRQDFDRGLEDDDDDNEDDEEIDEVKRSSQPGPREYDPDDYYLLKVLEKTEQEERKRELEEEEEQKRELEEEEEQKRELEEEEEREERRATPTQYSDKVDPQAIYKLIQISQKLQIPPEDLMDMLKSGEMTKQDRTPLRTQAQSWTPNDLARVEDKLTQISSHQKNKIPPETFFNRRLPETQTSNVLEEINTEDILKILGLGSVANQNAPALKKHKQHTSPPSRFYAPAGKQKDYMLSEPNVPEKGKNDYDNTVDEDELSTYLAAQMLAQYPQTANKADQKKRASQPPSQDHQLVLGTFEEAIQDYFDQMDSDKSPPQKRQSEPEEDMGDVSQTQGLDDDTLLKILGYLNPETEEGEDKDLYTKTVKGI